MKGHLIIAGGNIKTDRIYQKFVELAGGKEASIAIVPTASEEISETLEDYIKVFEGCGVNRERIVGIKIDPDGNCKDEWERSGDDLKTLGILRDVKGVWFSGGDQIRIVRGFLRADGEDTRVLKRIKEILYSGGVVGGTSAGAAIMSEVMIGGGTSYGALSMPYYRDYVEYRKRADLEKLGALLIVRGLGFLKNCVVDQHFDKRSRMGRLLETLFSEGIDIGFGVSEDTAMIYNLESQCVEIIGSGGVTILRVSEAERYKVGNYSRLLNVKISFIRQGDRYNQLSDQFFLNSEEESISSGYYACNNYLKAISLKINNLQDPIKNLTMDKAENILSFSRKRNMYYINKYQDCSRDIGYEIRLYNKKWNTKVSFPEEGSFIGMTMDIIPITQAEKNYKAVMNEDMSLQ